MSRTIEETCNKNEKQLHNVIKVLWPKVYIIDSSNFKELVQELIGIEPQTKHKPHLVIEIEDSKHEHHSENCIHDGVFSIGSSINFFHYSCTNQKKQGDSLAY
ncbi:hypothetical protein SLE2022_118100 [Rubroshorea leprosula]